MCLSPIFFEDAFFIFPQEILDSLAELYSLLQEEDMWAGLWQKRCKFPETSTAIAYEQHGFFEQVSRRVNVPSLLYIRIY